MRFIIVTYEAAQTFTSRSELLAYSLIATCTQDGCGNWHGGYTALADAIGVSKRSIVTTVNALIEKGYIKSETAVINGRAVNVLTAVKFCGEEISPECKDFTARGEEISPLEVKKQHPITSNNNIYKNNVSNNAHARGFQAPTVDEVREYCDSRNNGIDAEQFVAFYAARGWKFSNGAPVKDWKACVITWEKRDNARTYPQPVYQQPKREGFAEANARVLAQIDQMF